MPQHVADGKPLPEVLGYEVPTIWLRQRIGKDNERLSLRLAKALIVDKTWLVRSRNDEVRTGNRMS